MGFDKLAADLCGRPVVVHSLAAFDACAEVETILLVCASERREEFETLAAPFRKVRQVLAGGSERMDSVLAGVSALGEPGTGYVAVHDGARPLITPAAISACFLAAREAGAAACAEPVADTLHRSGPDGCVRETISRENLWRMQTPQIVAAAVLKNLLLEARESGIPATDEVSLLLRAGGKARVVENPDWNFKVTFPRDLSLAEAVLKNRNPVPEHSS